MKDYNQFVTAVNKIFDYLEKMKAGWNNQDNYNYIESIEEYKQEVIRTSELLKTQAPVAVAPAETQAPAQVHEPEALEALGND